MYCKKCGQEIDNKEVVCPHCGTPVAENESQIKKQKKAKKPFYKRWWFWLIVVIFLLGSCGSDTEAPVETTPSVETAVAPTEAATTQATEAATVETDPIAAPATTEDLDVAVGLLESVIKENFDNYEIYHENGIIILNIWEPGIAIGATMAAEGDTENLAAWNDFIENQKDFCLTLCDFVESLGLDETMVMVNVLNDLNKENVLLSIAQGVVISNCVE